MPALALRILIILPCILIVPGYLLFRSSLDSKNRYPPFEIVFIVLCVSVSFTSLVALFLAEAGLFNVWLVAGVVISVSLLISVILKRRGKIVSEGRACLSTPRVEVILFISLIVFGGVFFFRPAQYLAGDGDPGYYFNIGYSIAQSGSVKIHDPSVAKMTDFEIKTFYKGGVAQFIPFHLRNRKNGEIQPLLYDLIPVWIAVFISIFGKHGGLYAVSFFALLSSLGIFVLASKLSGRWWGGIAAFLFVSFYPQVWFSRMPASEVVCQLFVVACVYFLLLYAKEESPLLAVAIVLSLAAAALSRPEAAIAPVILFLAVLVRAPFKKELKNDQILANGLLLALVLNWVYVKFYEYHYVRTNLRKIVDILGGNEGMDTFLVIYIACVITGFVLYNGIALLRPRIFPDQASGEHKRKRSESARAATKALLVLAIFISLNYFYFAAPARGRLHTSPQKFFFSASVFLGGFAIVLFIAGICLMLFDMENLTVSFFVVSLSLVYLVVFTEASITSGYLPWLARRYLPVLYPMLIIGFCYMLSRIFSRGNMSLRVASLILASGMFAFFILSTSSIFNHVEYRGFERQLENISDQLKGNTVVFTSQFLGEAVGIPLKYQYGIDARRAYVLNDPDGLRDMVRQYVARNTKVLIEMSGLSSIEYSVSLFEKLKFEKRFDFTISFARLGKAYRVIPRSRGIETHKLVFFEIMPARNRAGY